MSLRPSASFRRPLSTTRLLRFAALVLVTGIASCAGSWAQATDVRIAAMANSGITADAVVFEATSCGSHRNHRCVPTGGSDILLQVDGTKTHGMFAVSLATGTCRRPVDARFVTRFSGSEVVRVHVPVPVAPLTSGRYLLVVAQNGRKRSGYGCGVIERGS